VKPLLTSIAHHHQGVIINATTEAINFLVQGVYDITASVRNFAVERRNSRPYHLLSILQHELWGLCKPAVKDLVQQQGSTQTQGQIHHNRNCSSTSLHLAQLQQYCALQNAYNVQSRNLEMVGPFQDPEKYMGNLEMDRIVKTRTTVTDW